MASNVPPVLTEMILSGPEIVLVDDVLATALEHAGLNIDEDPGASGLPGPLAHIRTRWMRHVYALDSGGCALSVDGIGLRVLTVPLGDIPVIAMALKGHLVDLTFEPSGQEDDPEEEGQQVQVILEIIARLEALL